MCAPSRWLSKHAPFNYVMCVYPCPWTRATVSLLNLDIYKEFFTHLPRQHPSTALCSCSSSKIDIMGTIQPPVCCCTKHLTVFSFHIARRGANLLGLDLFTRLGFSLMDASGSAVLQVASPWQQKWPILFNGLGCLTTITQQPLLDSTVTPFIQPLRRILLALRDEVAAELKLLLATGIIKPVNAAPWISNLLVARK